MNQYKATNDPRYTEEELTPQLLGLEGQRVEVVDSYGDTRRFYVGRSTGWRPIHIEVKRIDSLGGSAVTGAPFKSVTVVRGKWRAAVAHQRY